MIQNGFQKAGISHYCESAVLKEQLETEACRRWSSLKESQEAAV
jgi:hypothetical protein